MKCNHEKIILQVSTVQTFNVNPESAFNFDSDITTGYTIICKFCNYNKTFKSVDKFPRWLYNRWDKINQLIEDTK